jgi:hypothetical protein
VVRDGLGWRGVGSDFEFSGGSFAIVDEFGGAVEAVLAIFEALQFLG